MKNRTNRARLLLALWTPNTWPSPWRDLGRGRLCRKAAARRSEGRSFVRSSFVRSFGREGESCGASLPPSRMRSAKRPSDAIAKNERDAKRPSWKKRSAAGRGAPQSRSSRRGVPRQLGHVRINFVETTTCVETNGDSTILSYENGDWSFTGGLPKGLHDKLRGRQPACPPRPTYVRRAWNS